MKSKGLANGRQRMTTGTFQALIVDGLKKLSPVEFAAVTHAGRGATTDAEAAGFGPPFIM